VSRVGVEVECWSKMGVGREEIVRDAGRLEMVGEGVSWSEAEGVGGEKPSEGRWGGGE